MSYRIFIVEDEGKIRKELSTFLNNHGYDTVISTNFENIVKEILEAKPDIILLDINLPFTDGFSLCRELRKSSDVPIIVVTSRDKEIDELMSIKLGADDFITKPYNTEILLARIASILKRSYPSQSKKLECNGLIYDMSLGTLMFNENIVELTKNEGKILYALIREQGNIVSRDVLIKMLWQSDEFIDDNTLTVNINRLRKKIEGIGAKGYLKTKRGQGYILQWVY